MNTVHVVDCISATKFKQSGTDEPCFFEVFQGLKNRRKDVRLCAKDCLSYTHVSQVTYDNVRFS